MGMISCSVIKTASAPKVEVEFMLNGTISRNDLIKNFPWFNSHYFKYQLNDTAIAELRLHTKNWKVIVVMGTWCGDSKEHVPEFFKVADAIGVCDSQIEMIAVDRKKKCASVDISSYNILYVPTFILYDNEKEIGRIVEAPHETLEKDMLGIVHALK